MLSDIEIFDPLGWLVPVTLKLKLMMQAAWLQKLDWDAVLPQDIAQAFLSWRIHLVELRKITIPRLVSSVFSKPANSLHVFCDASETASAACIYLRVTDPDKNQVKVSLLTAKCKVAPLKQLSIPRL